MGFAAILRTLLNEGRMPFSGAAFPDALERQEAETVIGEFERQYRLDCPGQPPQLSMPAAIWAGEMFYGAAVALTYREIDEAGVGEILSQRFPTGRDASAHYSVDLIFRLLPDLYTRVKAASRFDPLLNHLEKWAKEWPLSSVGISGVAAEPAEEILSNDCLRILYMDRIIASKDRSRLTTPEVQNAVRAAYGIHHQLAPEIHAALTKLPHEATPE